MEFIFETEYNARTMACMAKVLRKTIRKKRSRRSHGFGWIVVVLGLLLIMVRGLSFDFRTILTVTAVLVIVFALIFEDEWNGYLAKKRLLPGTEKVKTVFSTEGFVSITEVGTTEWKYDKIQLLAETATAFVFAFSANHAQVYEKKNLQGGAEAEFRQFIEEATNKKVQAV